MKNLFSQFYTLSDSEIDKVWDDALFVLDTNVLLNLHRYNESTSDDILKAFEKISDRLWVPYQVALEYHGNLESTVIEQLTIYESVKSAIERNFSQFGADLGGLKLKTNHSKINTDQFFEKLNNAKKEFIDDLEELKNKQPSHNEALDNRIKTLLDGKIGLPPNNQEDLDRLYKDFEERYKRNRPPGFRDKNKDGYCYDKGLCYQKKYGDAILWHQIIIEAKERNIDNLIFITDDFKEDWWRETGGQKRGPRHELIDEIQTKANVKHFHLYRSERFLEFAKQKYDLDVDNESILHVRSIVFENEKYEVSSPIKPIMEWIEENYPDSVVFRNNDSYFPIDCIVKDLHYGFSIILLSSDEFLGGILRKFLFNSKEKISKGYFDRTTLIIIANRYTGAFHQKYLINNMRRYLENEIYSKQLDNCELIVGEFLENSSRSSKYFVPFYRTSTDIL